jgi:hypothetical protein
MYKYAKAGIADYLGIFFMIYNILTSKKELLEQKQGMHPRWS